MGISFRQLKTLYILGGMDETGFRKFADTKPSKDHYLLAKGCACGFLLITELADR